MQCRCGGKIKSVHTDVDVTRECESCGRYEHYLTKPVIPAKPKGLRAKFKSNKASKM